MKWLVSLAWTKWLLYPLAVLAALASQALHAADQAPPPALAPFLAEVRSSFPPVDAPRRLSADAARLAATFAPGATAL